MPQGEKMSPLHRQEFCVRWNSHLGSIGAAFPQLLAGQRFVDVTLACEGHQVHCHRLVLAACSSYFESILAENPCKHPVIILPSDIKLWEIQALVDFMYKGEVNVTQAGLPQLLRCAEQLRIRGLYGSDAALNLNQLKALTSKAAQQQTNNTTSAQSTGGLPADSNDDDTATNSTTTTTATATSTIQHNPQHVVIKKEPMAVSHNRPVLTPVSLNSLMANPTINSSFSAPQSDDECTSNAYEQFENSQNATTPMSGSEALPSNLMTTNHLDSTIEDDHNYVAHDEDDCLAGNMADTEHDATAGNSVLQVAMDQNNSLRRIRRSEESLEQAAKCVSKGQTFQTVSNMYNIPVSTIRFYMARKGILPKRKRGRGASSSGGGIGHNNIGNIQNSGYVVGSTGVIAANPALAMSAAAAASTNAATAMSQALSQIKSTGSPNPNQYSEEPYHHMMGYKMKPGTAHLV